MTALAPVASKIAKLIPLLASHQESELVATARAIERTLKSAGLDLHDLAHAVEHEPRPKVPPVHGTMEPNGPTSWVDMARWCRRHDGGRLSDHEHAFIRDMADRLVCGGEPSEKQATWLRAIHAKLRRGDQR